MNETKKLIGRDMQEHTEIGRVAWDEASPEVRAEFEAERFKDFAYWIARRKDKQRQQQLEALGVPSNEQGCSDAYQLSTLTDETRARLLFDGKSLP